MYQGRNQIFVSGGGSFHEISFDDVIVLRAYSTMVQKFCKITPKMRIFVHSGSKF